MVDSVPGARGLANGISLRPPRTKATGDKVRAGLRSQAVYNGAFGTVHVGIGTGANLGGGMRAVVRLDGMMFRPTPRLDGRLLLEDGRLVL